MSYRPELLPPAPGFYQAELGKLTRANSKGWAMGRCPFHESKSGKSFSVNIQNGAFCCFGCDAKGSSVLNFVMQRERLTFKEAAIRLGAWTGPMAQADREAQRRREHLQLLVRQKARAAAEAERAQRLEIRGELHSLIAIERQTKKRMSALPTTSAEFDQCVEVLSLLTEEIREADQAYACVAGLESR